MPPPFNLERRVSACKMNARDAGLATANALPMDKPPILKMSVSFVGLCEVVAFLSLTGTWLGSLGRYHWMLDLMAHFRLQYIVRACWCCCSPSFGAGHY